MFQNWLHPLSASNDQAEEFYFGTNIKRYEDVFPDLKSTKIALVGIDQREADEVRKALYQLNFGFKGLDIADLGNLRKQSPEFIIPLLRELLDSQLFPIIIGRDFAQSTAQYKAFNSLQKLISLAIVDEKLRFLPGHIDRKAYFLNELIEGKDSDLFHLSFIGSQVHFSPQASLDFLDQKYYDYIRLGQAKSNLSELEPFIRDADLLCFNLAALKQSEAPGVVDPSPSGFVVEDACQIMRYAGMSDKLKALGIYGYRSSTDRKNQTAQAVAQMIWYFIDGFYNRKGDFPASTKGMTEYIVEFKKLDYQLTFWYSAKSGRWWMQIPVKTQAKYKRHRLVPCSYNDYIMACQDELPERLIQAMRRF